VYHRIVRIGLVCSGGGAAAKDTQLLFLNVGVELEISMVSDRNCRAQETGRQMRWRQSRIEYSSIQEFSLKSAEYLFINQQVNLVCLFYSKKVSSDLFEKGPVVNFHPGLLPAFPGLSALEKFGKSTSKIYGATIHQVTDTIDGGPVISQIATVAPEKRELYWLTKVSHLQKVYLFASLISSLINSKQNAYREDVCAGSTVTPVGIATATIRQGDIYSSFLELVAREAVPPQYLTRLVSPAK
jgi:phosphoribosylglycinamide formyltransferase 1